MKKRAPSAVIVWPTRPRETPSVVIWRQIPVCTSWAHRSLNDALVVLPPKTYIVSPTAHAQCRALRGHGGARRRRRRHLLPLALGDVEPVDVVEAPAGRAAAEDRRDRRSGRPSAPPRRRAAGVHLGRRHRAPRQPVPVSDGSTHDHRHEVVSKSQVSLRNVTSPCRPPNIRIWSPTDVSVADCRASGVAPAGRRKRHSSLAPRSARSLSSTHRSLNSPSFPCPPKT